MAEIGMSRNVQGTIDEVLARLPEALKAEGFGVLTRIDVQETLKQKIGVDFRRYHILGACNPKLAHQALSQVATVGVLLPCNVVVQEVEPGRALVTAVDPLQTLARAEPALEPIAAEVRARLERVLAAL
jgi:uncharacterized protein (DUF302 family)